MDLGIGQLFSLTPKVKRRIEPLWNTLQDRLTGEMRLLGIKDIDGANPLRGLRKVLPKLIAKHNEKLPFCPPNRRPPMWSLWRGSMSISSSLDARAAGIAGGPGSFSL